MNIDDLTIGEVKRISALTLGGNSGSSITSSAIGSYVIVRSRNEGINAGLLKAADDTGCILSDARRIWYHKPSDTNTAWYEGVSQSGLSGDSKISCEVSEKYIMEDYSITVCTQESEKSIRGFKSHGS